MKSVGSTNGPQRAADEPLAAAEPAAAAGPWGDPRLRNTRRVPLVLQTEAAECGLACLAMIAGAHGARHDLATLREQLPVSLKGLTLAQLLQLAQQLHLDGRAVRAEPEQLRQLALPCVLHWDLNHFVVLVGWRGSRALIHDPARGERLVDAAALSRHFTGVALELQPGHGFVRRDTRRRVRWRDLLGPVRGLRGALAQVLLLALALEAFVLFSPFLMQFIVDGVLPAGDRDLLATLVVGFALLVVLQLLAAGARAWAVLALSSSLNLQWLVQVFGHLLRLPLPWFEKRFLGDVWSRFSSVQHIQRAVTTGFIEAVLDGLMVLLTGAVMLVYSPALAAVSAVAVALYAAGRVLLLRPMARATEEAVSAEARQNGLFLESVRGVTAIKLFNAQGDRLSRYASQVVETMNAQLGTRRIELWVGLGQRALFGFERVAVVGLGAALVLDGRLSLGMLFAFVAWRETFVSRIAGLVDKLIELRLLRLHGERLADIVLTPAEALGAEGGAGRADAALPEGQACSLAVEDLHVNYGSGETPVLRGVSLRVEAGESVAIVGPSGCGKTTLLKAIVGIHPAERGRVLVNGQPVDALGLAAWRARVGVVMQDEPLFTGSIADNISFFAPEPDRAWLEQCARIAAIHDEIAALPMGYQTLIGDMGAALSGGQKQRLLLARALYKRPGILLLDEATSALDVERERQVNAAIRQLAITRVIVAHRPETIASAQRVIALHEGRVAQDLRSVHFTPNSTPSSIPSSSPGSGA